MALSYRALELTFHETLAKALPPPLPEDLPCQLGSGEKGMAKSEISSLDADVLLNRHLEIELVGDV